MNELKVDTRELGLFSLHLGDLSRELGAASAVRHDYDGRSGSAQIDGRLAAFYQHWSDGMYRLHNHLDEISLRLDNARSAYETAEAKIAQAAGDKQ